MDTTESGFKIERVGLETPLLKGATPPLRLVHLSDLHLKSWIPRHRALVEAVQAWEPDFVFITGDLRGGRRFDWEATGRLLSGLTPRHGIFVTRGNWEVRARIRVDELRRRLAAFGAELLQNESRVVDTRAGAIRVCGVDDLSLGWPNLQEATAEGPEAAYTVLLSHAPLAARFVGPAMGVDLLLSGHTHGGQIRIPLLWRLALPSCHGGYAHGLYREPWGYHYVSRGYDAGGVITLRFRCPREATFLEVSPKTRA